MKIKIEPTRAFVILHVCPDICRFFSVEFREGSWFSAESRTRKRALLYPYTCVTQNPVLNQCL
jgi:hypothetical protein